ncbi:MAG: ATP-binding protein [Opitutaceae bacterium]
MKPLPIRWKFALWTAGLVGVVVVVFAAATFLNVYQEQIEAVDLELAAEGRHLAARGAPDLLDKSLDELVRFQPWLAVALFDATGHLARRTEKLSESVARAALTQDAIHTARDAQGGAWRLETLHENGTTIVVAYSLEEVQEIVDHLLIAYGLSLPVVLLIAAFGGWWVSGRALAPLRTFTAAAESIGAAQLDRRVPVPAAEDEIRRLAQVLNAMLGRLGQSFEQARRFAADASHELRTPLTIMSGEIERLLRTPGLNSGHEQKLLSLQEEIGRLDRITDHLLLLARFDAGSVAVRRERIDFTALVREVCEDAELLADARGIELHYAAEPGLAVVGDDAHLRRAMLSLLDNATRYNEPGGQVRLTLQKCGDTVELRVRNTGPGIPAGKRAQLFQRFFRVDAARSRGGHGLGLSLSREIARAHGGELALDVNAGSGWTEFVLTLAEAPRLVESEAAAQSEPV